MNVKKPSGNLKRPNGGEWDLDNILGSQDPDASIPKTGWAVVSGKTAIQTTIYHNGKIVKNVKLFDYHVEGGKLPILKLEIVAPEIKMTSKGIGYPKGK